MRYESLATKHVAIGLAPVADGLAGTVASDVVDVSGHQSVTFYLIKAAGATGTSTITVEACDDVTPTNTTAVPFYYRAVTATDVNQAMTAAAAAGFTTTAGANQVYIIEVDHSELMASGYNHVRLKAVEVANDPVLAGILIVLNTPRFGQSITNSVIA
jgi:hypothetical protein